uniref:Transcriptional repressor p66 alpha-like n=1 Tax=Saccoglossus kowalevskii TaxID=10224 RepID=A0ABM0MEY5_SACKO|nr:PREDICTED: transcriptional repressor p66 alpha-like [Saccoglossus kowalevskii]
MSDDASERVTRSGRRSMPSSPTKLSERRSSADSSSSERCTLTGKRQRTCDSEDDNPGSPGKSSLSSLAKRSDPDQCDGLHSSKRARTSDDDHSVSSQELSSNRENNGDHYSVQNVDGENFIMDDSDPEVSFKENSFRVTEEDVKSDNEGEAETNVDVDKSDVPLTKEPTKVESLSVSDVLSNDDQGNSQDSENGVKNTDILEKEPVKTGDNDVKSISADVLDINAKEESVESVPEISESKTEPKNSEKDFDKKLNDKSKEPEKKVALADEQETVCEKDETTELKETTSEKDETKESNTSEKDETKESKNVSVKNIEAVENTATEIGDESGKDKGEQKDVEMMEVIEDESSDKPQSESCKEPQNLSVINDASENKDEAHNKENDSQCANTDSSAESERIQRLREERKNSSSPEDIIVLSDDSSGPMMNGIEDDSSDASSPRPPKNGIKTLTPEQNSERDKLIRRLQEELRNEEAKLLLLKRLRQSQLQPAVVKDQSTAQSGVAGKLPIPRNPTAAPPPLVRGGQVPKQQQQVIMPQLVRGNQLQTLRTQGGAQGPPPLMLGPRSGLHIQQPQLVRPPIVRVGNSSNLVTYATTPTTYTSMQQMVQSQQIKVSTPMSSMSNESPASRQAAAKLALRKQLEKTLLQIPPPKPPPPELHFLPSAANNEFIYLVGLEEIVNRLMEDPNKVKEFIEPFICTQCKTDFSTVWKRDTKRTTGVVCENCVVTNQKKALKAEHTNRLKTAFVKALQQEQEIEQRMSQSTASTNNSTHTTHREHLQKVQQEQMRQHQQLVQAHQQQMQQRQQARQVYTHIPQAHLQPGITYAYIPQILPKSQVITTTAQANDRQREYLLDMIPSRTIQTVNWKQ